MNSKYSLVQIFVCLRQNIVGKQIIFHCAKYLMFSLEWPWGIILAVFCCSPPLVISIYSFILTFRVLFSSQGWGSVSFNGILKSCLKPGVLCSRSPLGQCSASSEDWVEQIICETWFPELPNISRRSCTCFFASFSRDCGMVVLCVCVCVCVENLARLPTCLLSSAIFLKIWGSKICWKASVFLLSICPAPITLAYVSIFCWLTCN